MNITKWISNHVNQLIGTVPSATLKNLTVENKTSVGDTHTTNTEETTTPTTRTSLSSEEKMFIEHTIFSAPLYTTRTGIIDLIAESIHSISGIKREKNTIKYYIYEGLERKKPENRPYRLIFGQTKYGAAFKQQAIQESIKLGQRETHLKFALPWATLAGWLDQNKSQTKKNTTNDHAPSSPPTQTKNIISDVTSILQKNTTSNFVTKPNPVEKEAAEILDALIQMQNINKKLTDEVQLHIKELAKMKKQVMSDFFLKEQSCEQLTRTVTATEANIESALNTLVRIETATRTTKKAREATISNLDRDNTRLRTESEQLKRQQEQIQKDLQEVVKNIPKIK